MDKNIRVAFYRKILYYNYDAMKYARTRSGSEDSSLKAFISCASFFMEKCMKYVDKYMKIAFREAEKANRLNETPIGAVIVYNNEIIAKGYNKKNKTNNVLDHAELIAIRKASKKLKNWRLYDCDIYVTLEPCPMCASAIRQSRIKNIYYNDSNIDKNNLQIIKHILHDVSINPKTNIEQIKSNSNNILSSFFQTKR